MAVSSWPTTGVVSETFGVAPVTVSVAAAEGANEAHPQFSITTVIIPIQNLRQIALLIHVIILLMTPTRLAGGHVIEARLASTLVSGGQP